MNETTQKRADQPPHRLWRWGWVGLKLLVMLLVLGMVLVLLYAMVTNVRGCHAVNTADRKLEQHGIPNTIAGVRGQLRGGEGPDQASHREAKRNQAMFKAAARLAEAARAEAGGASIVPRDERPGTLQKVEGPAAEAARDFVERNPLLWKAIEQLRELDRFDWELNLSEPHREGMFVPAHMRGLVRAIEVKSLHHQGEGHAEAAADALASMLEISRLFEDEPWTLIYLVRASIPNLMRAELEQLLSRFEVDPEVLDDIQGQLLREADSYPLSPMLKITLAEMVEQAREVHDWTAQWLAAWEHLGATGQYRLTDLPETNGIDQFFDLFMDTREPPDWQIRMELTAFRLWSTLCPGYYRLQRLRTKPMNSDNAFEIYLNAYALAGQPWDEKARRYRQWNNAQDDEGPSLGPMTTVGTLLRTRAEIHAAATALAVERYRLEHGDWPEELDQLAGDLPSDPFAGEPMRYKRHEKGVVVYSVGETLEDVGVTETHQRIELAFYLYDPAERGNRGHEPE